MTDPRLSNYVPVPESGCWLWLGAWGPKKYGTAGGTGAHRFFYSRLVSPIPDGLYVCHKCDTPCCVNPDHLFLGTHDDNMADRKRKGRIPHGEKNVYAKLCNDAVLDIRSSLKRSAELAAVYGVHIKTIEKIKRGARWPHLPKPTSPKRASRKQQDNMTGFSGVTRDKRDGMFYARIYRNKKRHDLGRYSTAEKAAAAYAKAAALLHGGSENVQH
jgi:hypothetical protein